MTKSVSVVIRRYDMVKCRICDGLLRSYEKTCCRLCFVRYYSKVSSNVRAVNVLQEARKMRRKEVGCASA
jgi:hypothetical protein